MTEYIVASIIAILALIPPVSIKIHATVNSTPWLWIMLLSGFSGLIFLNTKANIWIKLILVYCFINCFLSRAPYLSFSIYSSVVASAFFYLLCTKIKDYEIIFKTYQAIFLLFVILIVMQLFKTDTLLNFNRPGQPVYLGTIGNMMMLASFIVCIAPFLLAYRKFNIVPILIVGFLSGSRGLVLAIFAGIMFYLFFKIKRKFVYVSILLILSVALGYYGFKDTAVSVFWTGGRGPIWKKTIELANERPLQGHAIGTFKVLFPVLAPKVSLSTGVAPSWSYEGTTGTWLAWRRAHNAYLQILFETGYLGFALFLGLLGFLAWKFIKARKNELTILTASGLIMIVVNAIIHFPFRMEQNILSIICFLAYHEKVCVHVD